MFRRGGKTTNINSGTYLKIARMKIGVIRLFVDAKRNPQNDPNRGGPSDSILNLPPSFVPIFTSFIMILFAAGRKRMHTTWEDGSELIEEYDLKTDELLVRKYRKPSTLGALGDWDFLFGAPPTSSGMMTESSRNPVFTYVVTYWPAELIYIHNT